MTCVSKPKRFFQSQQEVDQQVEELLELLVLQLRQLRRISQQLEEDEFVRRQLLTFLPAMESRINVFINIVFCCAV
jgi:hypothetical protein